MQKIGKDQSYGYNEVFQHVSLKSKFTQKCFPNHGSMYII